MPTNKRAQQPPESVVVGRVARPHGVRGALILEPLSPLIRSLTPDSKIFLGDPPEAIKLEDIRPHRDRYLLIVKGCHSREEADLYRDAELTIRFDDADPLPAGEYYYWQILGLQVVIAGGDSLGEVVQIIETGANDVYVVRAPDGREHLIPAIKQVIKKVDLDGGHIDIELLPGLLTP